jgi:hypothetical protein
MAPFADLSVTVGHAVATSGTLVSSSLNQPERPLQAEPACNVASTPSQGGYVESAAPGNHDDGGLQGRVCLLSARQDQPPRLRCPRRDCFLGEPNGQAAALTQTGFVIRPVGHLVALSRNMVTAVLVQLEWHGEASGSGKRRSPMPIQPQAPPADPCTTAATG